MITPTPDRVRTLLLDAKDHITLPLNHTRGDWELIAAVCEEWLAGQWQPIETAPKNGRVVLTQHVMDLYPVAGWFNNGDWLWYRETEGPEDKPGYGKNMPLYAEPTHWRPLPSPPEKETP